MSDFKHTQQERLSRQQAAERLIDIAYALTAGGELELSMAGQRVKAAVSNQLDLGRELKSEDGRVELDVALTWSSPEAAPQPPDDEPVSTASRPSSD